MVCDELEILGCMDIMACNYNNSATDDDNLCVFQEEGYNCDGSCMMDSDGDGVCDKFEVVGCMDTLAYNYDASATDDNSSCYYADMYHDCNGMCINDSDVDMVCDELKVLGCMDMMACNYMELATDQDSCIYSSDLDDCATCSGETDGTGTINDNDEDDDGICNSNEIVGCTDALACNYDATPTTDTDNSLCNYSTDLDECATCSGETDGSGTIIDNDFNDDGICDEVDYDDGIGVNEISGVVPILIKMIDVLGREQQEKIKGSLLFYIYDNGKLEKRVVH